MSQTARNLLFKVILVWGGLVLLSAFGYYAWKMWNLLKSEQSDLTKWGVFGDSFGALTSLFTLLGILGLIYSQRQVQEQIALQVKQFSKQEFNDTLHKLTDNFRSTYSSISEPQHKTLGFVGIGFDTAPSHISTFNIAADAIIDEAFASITRYKKDKDIPILEKYSRSDVREKLKKLLHTSDLCLFACLLHIDKSNLSERERVEYSRLHIRPIVSQSYMRYLIAECCFEPRYQSYVHDLLTTRDTGLFHEEEMQEFNERGEYSARISELRPAGTGDHY
jgi:hypothetical protein